MRINEKYEITDSMCDLFGFLKLSHIFTLMQNVAYKDLTVYGYPRKSLMEKDTAFFLRRAIVHVLNAPKIDDVITVGTSQVKRESLLYTRDFKVENKGNTCVVASTQWFLASISRKKIQRTVIETESFIKDTVNIPFEILENFDIDNAMKYKSLIAGYSSLDSNIHVNNTEYVTWSTDAPGVLNLLKKGRYAFDIHFKHGVVHNDKVDLYNKDYDVCGIVKDNICFNASFSEVY